MMSNGMVCLSSLRSVVSRKFHQVTMYHQIIMYENLVTKKRQEVHEESTQRLQSMPGEMWLEGEGGD